MASRSAASAAIDEELSEMSGLCEMGRAYGQAAAAQASPQVSATFDSPLYLPLSARQTLRSSHLRERGMPSEAPQDLTDAVTEASSQTKSSRRGPPELTWSLAWHIRGVDATPQLAGVQRHYLASESVGKITVVRSHESALRLSRSEFSYFGQSPAGSVPTHDAVKPRLVLLLPTGDVLEFQDFSQTTKPQGLFSRQIAPGGRSTDNMAYSKQRVTEIRSRGMVKVRAPRWRRDSSLPPAGDSLAKTEKLGPSLDRTAVIRDYLPRRGS